MTAPAESSATDFFKVKLDAKGLKRASMHGSMLFGSAQVFRVLLQLCSQIVLARLLFPSDFGLVAMVSPVIAFVSIFSVGFGEAVVQRSELDQERVSALFWLATAMSIVVTLILMAAAPLTAFFYGDDRLTLLMIVVASYFPISALGGAQGALLTRQMKFGVITGIEVTTATLATVVTVFTAWLGWSYWSLAAGNIAAAVAGAALNWQFSDWRPSRPRYVPALAEDLKFGGNITGFNLATFLTQSGDNIIIGAMNGERALGLYDRSYRLVVMPIGQIIAPIGRVALPLLSRLVSDPAEYGKVFTVIVQVILLLTVPGMLTCVVYGPEIVNVLLGPRWTEAGVLLSWISVGGLTSGIQSPALWLFVSQGRMRGLRRMTMVTCVLNLASFGIGSLWGIEGVAIAVGLTFSLVTTPLILYGATRNGPFGTAALVRACLPFFGAGLMAAALLVAAHRMLDLSDLVHVLVGLVISYAVFAIVLLARAQERRQLVAALRMLKR